LIQRFTELVIAAIVISGASLVSIMLAEIKLRAENPPVRSKPLPNGGAIGVRGGLNPSMQSVKVSKTRASNAKQSFAMMRKKHYIIARFTRFDV
jgi:hypothetical protein